MTINYQPSLDEGKYICPRCKVYSSHKHYKLKRSVGGDNQDVPDLNLKLEAFNRGRPAFHTIENEKISFDEKEFDERWVLHVSVCIHCLKYTIWENKKIIFPFNSDTPQPSPDMPEEVRSVYEEAQLIYEPSPRASAALLRLAIETLIPKLNYQIKPKRLNDMIGELAEQKIPKHIKEGLDVIRFHGNRGMHTAEISMKDDKETVLFLFKLCNIIVDELITKDKEIKEFYKSIPETFQEQVESRDQKNKQ